MPIRQATCAALGIALLVATAGCAQHAEGNVVVVGSDDPSTPTFTGPWADAFAQAYRTAGTTEQRQMLADGIVSELEYSQVRDGFAACLADVGYTVTWAADGGYTLDVGSAEVDDAHVQDLVGACDTEHLGDIDYLYEQTTRNPQHLDEAEIMAACLVRSDVVPPSFTTDDYAAWFEADDGALPYTVSAAAGQVAFDACNADPLGLFG